MKLHVLWVGKTQEFWIRTGIDEYAGRIRRYCPLSIGEAKEEKGSADPALRERESDRLVKLLPRSCRLILLDETGPAMTSPQFAAFLGSCRDCAVPDLAFAIGGAHGFTDGFRARAHGALALSAMTMTHQMVRVVLLEQIYRGFTILNRGPYHH